MGTAGLDAVEGFSEGEGARNVEGQPVELIHHVQCSLIVRVIRRLLEALNHGSNQVLENSSMLSDCVLGEGFSECPSIPQMRGFIGANNAYGLILLFIASPGRIFVDVAVAVDILNESSLGATLTTGPYRSCIAWSSRCQFPDCIASAHVMRDAAHRFGPG